MKQRASNSRSGLARTFLAGIKVMLFVGVLALAISVLLYFVFFRGANLRSLVEKEMSQVLGLPVKAGNVEAVLPASPILHIHPFRIESSSGKAILEADEAWFVLDIVSLLRRTVNVTGIKLKGGKVFITRYADGSWNISPLWRLPSDDLGLAATEIKMEDSRLEIEDDSVAHRPVETVWIKSLHVFPGLGGKPGMTVSGNIGDGSFQLDGTLAPSLLNARAHSAEASKLELDLSGFDLSQINWLLAPHDRSPATMAGSIDARLKLSITKPLHFESSGFVALSDVNWAGSRTLAGHKAQAADVSGRLGFKVSGDAQGLHFRALYGHLNEVNFKAQGTLSQWLTARPYVDFHLATEDFDLKEAVAWAHDWLPAEVKDQAAWLSGIARYTGDIKGALHSPQTYANLDLKGVNFTPPQTELAWHQARGSLSIAPGSVTIRSLTAAHALGEMQIQGQIRGPELDLSVHFPEADLSELKPWLLDQPYWPAPPELLKVRNLEGNAEMDVKLQGHVAHPRPSSTRVRLMKAKLDYEGLDVPLRDLDGHLSYERGVLKVNDLQGHVGSSKVSMQGLLSVDGAPTMGPRVKGVGRGADLMSLNGGPTVEEIHIASPDFDLRLLQKLVSLDPTGLSQSNLYKRLRDPYGTAHIDLDYKNKAVRLNARFDNVGFRLSDVPMRFSDTKGSMRLENGTIYIEDISGSAGRSSFKIRGRVIGQDFESGIYSVSVESRLSFPEALALFPPWSGLSRLAVRGSVPFELKLDGSLKDGLEAKGLLVLDEETDLVVGSVFHKGRSRAKAAFDVLLTDRLLTVSDSTLELDDIPMKVTGKVWNFAEPEGTMDLYVKSPQHYRVDALASLFDPLHDLSGVRGEVGLDLHLSGPVQRPKVQGDMQLSGVGVSLFGIEIADATGTLQFLNDDVRFNKLTLTIGGTPATVSAQLHHGSALSGSLHFDHLDLDTMIAAVSDRGPASGQWRDVLRRQPLSLDVSAGSVQYRQVPLSNVSAQVIADEAGLSFKDMALNALGGGLHGNAHLNPESEEFSLDVEVKGTSVENLFSKILHQAPALSGNLSAGASFTGRGFDRETLNRTLHGSGRFEVSKGMLRQADLPQRILTMVVMLHEGLFGFNPYRLFQTIRPPEFKHFDTWKGDFTVEAGIIQLKESVFSSDALELNVSGQVLLESGKLEGKVVGRIPEVSPRLGHFGRFLAHLSVRNFARGLKGILTGHFPWSGSHVHAHRFTFTLKGDALGPKSIDHFRFLDPWYNVW